jgi:cell division protein FtsQ
MARKQGSPTEDDSQSFYRGPRGDDEQGRGVSSDEEPSALDDRLSDLDSEEDARFLRAQKRVPVRRGALPRKTANRLRWILFVLVAVAVVVGTGIAVYRYGSHSWRFRIESSDSIEVSGAEHVTREQVLETFREDISRNIFKVPLDSRKRALEDISWVESASVMRLLPNKLRVVIRERVPVAYVQLGSQISLIDANGVIMTVPPGTQTSYSFPVIIGMAESEPLSVRAPRMKTYTQLISELEADSGHYSQDLNEVDLSDPNDVKVTVADSAGAVLVHLGERQRPGIFLDRYKIYVAHLQEWRQQYPRLSSVDLRYEQQVVLDPADSVAKPAPAVQNAGSAQANNATTTPHEAPAKRVKPAKKHVRKR